MAAPGATRGSLRVVAGEVEAGDATSRLVIPSSGQPAWPPFARAGEVVVSVGRRFPSHTHQGEEVLTYVLEGAAQYKESTGAARSLPAGSAAFLTAPGRAAHTIGPEAGSTIRWFSSVVQLPATASAVPNLQWADPHPGDPQTDGSATRTLVGPNGPMRSGAGLSAQVIRFADDGTTFRRIGHDRRAIVYALRGRGEVDGRPIEIGEAALIDRLAGVALHGFPGFAAMLLTMPARP
ncbi:MAG TPA: pirin family protein [Thermoplasmata archaeon]|nr:pirin family protein [Thermoplasmata archaeon]